ncbi:replication/maintenance protein RepL [Crocosphaera sp.]|uniref:replication/maintenance protein RepL n=1 Tax=Crocosphaera sp. TaxID=2729996 RepID=UPI002580EE73|nr:replication/maintenance protein RepL [Crocosphaera sp.]NQZ65350.1 replication/maintenance protein RepL [Crocosphaera sp.]
MSNRKQKNSKRLFDAIKVIEEAGLSVYRRRRKEKDFMKIYSESLDRLLPKISPSAFKVFAALANEVGYENTIVEITKAELMEKTGLGENTVRASLNELEELEVMKRIGPPNRRKYVLNEMYVKKGK